MLFDDKTQYVFAQDEAGTKITAELGSSGDITAKIGAEITDAWEDFWVDLGETAHGVNTSLTTILSDIADFFTGSSSSSDGATVELDNLGTTSINKPLIFDLSVNAGADDDTVSISQANDDLYLKAPSGDRIYQQIAGTTIAEARSDQFKISKKLLFGNSSVPGNTETGIGVSNNGLYMKNSGSDKIYFQSGGNSLLRISGTQVESRHLVPQGNSLYKLGDSAARWSIGYIDDLKIYDDLAVADTIRVGSSSVPTSTTKLDGDIWKSGDDVMIQSGGSSRNISSAGGSGANAELSNLTDPTELNQGLSFEDGVDTRVDGGAAGVGADTGNDLYINVPSNFDRVRFSGNGTSHTEIHRYGLKLPSFSTDVENLIISDPAPGTIWYNFTTGKIRGREADDVTVDLSGGGSGGDSYTAATMEDFIQGLTTESAPSTGDYLMLDVGSEVRKVTLEEIGDLIGGGGGGSGYEEGDSPTFNSGTFTGSLQMVPLIKIQPHLSHIEGAC